MYKQKNSLTLQQQKHTQYDSSTNGIYRGALSFAPLCKGGGTVRRNAAYTKCNDSETGKGTGSETL